tara:strand:- start:402 stop:845 length:444 start_codon:yes stop_codon:yes gene_type:complete
MKNIFTAFLAIALMPFSAFGHDAPSTSEEKTSYIEDHIKLFETEATRIDTYIKKSVPAVRFALKNTGSETLTRIKVIVYFLDGSGQPFFEEDFLPVHVSDYSVQNGKPLKPNYTFRMDAGQYYTIEKLGDEWAGKVEFEISDIEFAE